MACSLNNFFQLDIEFKLWVPRALKDNFAKLFLLYVPKVLKVARDNPPSECRDKISDLRLKQRKGVKCFFYKILYSYFTLILLPESELALRLLPLITPAKLPTGVKNRPTVVEAVIKCRDNFIVDISVIFSV